MAATSVGHIDNGSADIMIVTAKICFYSRHSAFIFRRWRESLQITVAQVSGRRLTFHAEEQWPKTGSPGPGSTLVPRLWRIDNCARCKVQARVGDFETAEEAGAATALERICAPECRLRQAMRDTHNLTSGLKCG